MSSTTNQLVLRARLAQLPVTNFQPLLPNHLKGKRKVSQKYKVNVVSLDGRIEVDIS